MSQHTETDPPKLPREDHDLHGEWSPPAEAAYQAFVALVEHSERTRKMRRDVISLLYAVPEAEEKALLTALTEVLKQRGIDLDEAIPHPGHRHRPSLVAFDITDLFRS